MFATRPLPAFSAASTNGLVVDIGGTKVLIGAVRRGTVVEKRSIPIDRFAGASDMVDEIATTGRRLCAAAEMLVDSAVVAVAGRLDRASGTVLQAANLPFTSFPLADELSARLDGVPVRIEHDAACGLVGETAVGAARGLLNVVYLTVSTGVGVGILLDGRLLDGAHGAAGEVGHAPVASPGIACTCGSSGCLEAYASGRALAELGRRAATAGDSPALADALAAGGAITAKEVLSAARRGDRASVGIVDNAIGLLTRTVRMLLMTLDPDLVVLGGGVMANPYFADRVVSAARLPGDDHPRVRRAELGARSAMYGGVVFLGHPQSARNGHHHDPRPPQTARIS